MCNPKVGLCIGHSRKIGSRRDGGAVSVNGTQEWEYNNSLVDIIADELERHGIDSFIIDDYEGNGYTSAMTWLAKELKDDGVIAAVELHFNSATPSARGHEWLYWSTSTKGKQLAEACDLHMRSLVPEIRSRGAKPKGRGDRGAEFLKLTHCPAIIAEPFFGSNDDDWRLALTKEIEIGKAIARALTIVKEW